MAFDADAYLEALGHPTITIGGRTHKGRLLSIEEWLPFEPMMKKAAARNMEFSELKTLVKKYCRKIFPRRFRFWRRSVGSQILKLPPQAMIEAMVSFFECQGRVMVDGPSQEEELQGPQQDT